MASTRRLPNGRFARVTQVPEKKRRITRGEGGYLIISTNAAAAARELAVRRLSVDPALLDSAQKRAASIQAQMQGAATIEYVRASTGRFARGIKASVSASSYGDRSETIIRVTAFNYRETRFITNLGNSGFFKRFPVGPYPIWAKGARRLAEEVPIGISVTSRKNFIRVRRSDKVGRLKIPRPTAFFTAERKPGRGGGESRQINDALGPADPGDLKSAFFFYPLRVEHPGFKRDILSKIALEQGAKFVIEARGIVGRSYGGQGRDDYTNDLVVRDEIPLTRVIYSGRRQTSSRPSVRFT